MTARDQKKTSPLRGYCSLLCSSFHLYCFIIRVGYRLNFIESDSAYRFPVSILDSVLIWNRVSVRNPSYYCLLLASELFLDM